jgi:hypothetical protein
LKNPDISHALLELMNATTEVDDVSRLRLRGDCNNGEMNVTK